MSTEQTAQNDDYPLVSALTLIEDIRYIDLVIKCFEAQTYPEKELIIINNRKTQYKASELIIDARPNIFIIDTPQKLPAGQAKNYGISAANGRVIAQFDADCWHHPKRIEIQIGTMAKNSAHVSTLTKTLKYSMYSGVASYWHNNKNAILNTMIYSRPRDIDYAPVDKQEELSILTKMINSNRNVIAIDKPELMCKLYYSNNPSYKITKNMLTKKHKSQMDKILKTLKEQI